MLQETSPDLLVADGLDECDPIRGYVAAALKAWGEARPSTGICILTRPVGHAPDLLPGYVHAELLPLNRRAVESRAHWFTKALITNSEKSTAVAETFLESVADDSGRTVASIASRNPLLLTFLVRLHIDEVPIAIRRAALFESIIELMLKSQPNDRPEGPDLDRATAWRTVEILGWQCLEHPESTSVDLTEKIAEGLGSSLEASRLAEQAIVFWEERGLIERLTLRSLDAITFVHPALGEYAAGRQLKKLGSESIISEITRVRRHARYREPLLLAAGCGAVETIVSCLLSHDDPWDPAATEAVLAAAALAEVDPTSLEPKLINEVVEHLRQRLESTVPMVAIEAGAGLLTIAQLAPEIVGPIGGDLWNHSQEWTKLAARAVCLKAGNQYIDISEVVSMLSEFVAQSALPRTRFVASPVDSYDLRLQMMILAVERIIRELEPAKAEPLLKSLFLAKRLSIKMVEELSTVVQPTPYNELFNQTLATHLNSSLEWLENMRRGNERKRRSDRVFLKCVLKAVGAERCLANVAPDQSHALGALLEVLQVWESEIPEWLILCSDKLSLNVITEVIRGAVTAGQLPEAELADEVNSALERLESSNSLFGFGLPRVQLKPIWNRAVDASPDPALLAQALHIPCWPFALTAAELLAAGVGGDEAKSLVEEVLEKGRGRALLLAGVITVEIFERDAFDILNARLSRPLTAGCGNLYQSLIRSASPEQIEEAIECAIDGLNSENGRVASGAAEMLLEVGHDRLRQRVDELREAMQRWTKLGSWCDHCNVAVDKGSCPRCRVVTPTPRSALIPLLAQLGALTVDDLITLSTDPWSDVPKAAIESLTKLAEVDDAKMKEVLQKLFEQQGNVLILDAILALPTQNLCNASDQLLKLSDAPCPQIRKRAVLALSSSWVETSVATTIAKEKLNDLDPGVRNSATIVLRALSAEN